MITATITTIVRRTTTVLVHQKTVLVHQTTTIFQQVRLHGTASGQVKSTSSSPPKRKRPRRTIIIVLTLLLVAAGATVGGLRLFDKPSQEINGVSAFAISPNGKFIATAYYNDYPGKIYIWNVDTKRPMTTITSSIIQEGGTNGLAFTPDNKSIVVQSLDDPITIWNIATRRMIAAISDPRVNSGSCLVLSPDGKMLAICGEADSTAIDDNVYLVNIARRSVTVTLRTTRDNACQAGVEEAAFSPDGKVLAVSALPCYGNHSIQLWNIRTHRIITAIAIGYPLVYSHDGRMLVVGDNLIHVRQTSGAPESTRKILNKIAGSAAAFSPDNKTLVIAAYSSSTAILWKLAANEEIATLTDPSSNGIGDLAYMPDGKTLVTVDGNGNFYLWNVATQRIIATLARPAS